ncbi:class I adenylate-forming enzyme family protein [Saccharopolyspora spinosa]|uniref:class I adenylate-forming enzyme family protein n=1 Tax=Saccharopolyspora spinosa TaxID=60894 RepID=UPI00193144D1|nr:class I adenylate-forming enzyme family protein [Saccharopolyspora spinosa]
MHRVRLDDGGRLVAGSGIFSESVPLADLLVRSAHLHPERTALAFPGVRINYSELLDGATRTARALHALGVRRGDHVGVLMPNSPEFVESFFGAALLGAVIVPINARYRSAELGYVIDHARLRVVLITDRIAERTDFRRLLADALPSVNAADAPGGPFAEAPHLRHLVIVRGRGGGSFLGADEFASLATTVDPSVVAEARSRVRSRDVALLLYTSGTTAHPKGCLISHEAISRGSMGRMTENVPLGERNVFWCPSPMFHIACMQVLLASIGLGGTFVTDTHFRPDSAWQQIVEHDVTSLWPWFQAVMLGLEGAAGFDPAAIPDVHSFSLIGPPTFLRRIQALFPRAAHINGCGMSELSGYYAMSPLEDDQEARATTGGKPVSGVEVKIVDPETGEDVPRNALGEILIRGYLQMEGYYRDPERTTETIDADGWLHSGDLYRMDDAGHISYEGRLKDMLKVGGENVPAIEVESFLCTHPHIRIAEVVGIPDDLLDEVPVAFVEIEPGVSLDADEIIAWCRGRIASFKVPRAVHFKTAGEWPMSATKVNKVALRKEIAALMARTA